MTTAANIYVIDDDAAVRDSLDFMLSAAGHRPTVYDSSLVFLEAAAGLPDGCVVTDIRMPDMSGLELVRRLRSAGSSLPIVVITGHGDVALAVEAMKAGAADFIEKPFDEATLLSAVQAALLSRAGGERESVAADRLKTLSLRERQVLEGLVAGRANKVIARELAISPRTVEVYRAKLMAKAGVDSFAELIALAVRAGLGPVDQEVKTSIDPGTAL